MFTINNYQQSVNKLPKTNLTPLLRNLVIEKTTSLFNTKQSIRNSSSNDGDKINDDKYESKNTTNKQNETNLKEQLLNEKNQNKTFIEINLFGPKDIRAPLPGNVGLIPKKYLKKNKKIKNTYKDFKLINDHNLESKDCLSTTIEYNLNNYETIEDRQNRVVENVAYNLKNDQSLELKTDLFKKIFFVKVYSSTNFLLNDIKQIFPKECLFEKEFSIISVYQNPFSNKKDINFKKEFVELANSLSDSLIRLGFWSNYIKPNNSRYHSETLPYFDLEPNERFINYGVEIEEHGTCKLVNQINKTKLFIGTIFTTAKKDSPELKKILTCLTLF